MCSCTLPGGSRTDGGEVNRGHSAGTRAGGNPPLAGRLVDHVANPGIIQPERKAVLKEKLLSQVRRGLARARGLCVRKQSEDTELDGFGRGLLAVQPQRGDPNPACYASPARDRLTR